MIKATEYDNKLFHPQTNGTMLENLTDKKKITWKDHTNKLIFSYSCIKHSSTGYSVYHSLFGYKPLLPTDLILEQTPKVDNVTSNDQCLSKWEETIRQTYGRYSCK